MELEKESELKDPTTINWSEVGRDWFNGPHGLYGISLYEWRLSEPPEKPFTATVHSGEQWDCDYAPFDKVIIIRPAIRNRDDYRVADAYWKDTGGGAKELAQAIEFLTLLTEAKW